MRTPILVLLGATALWAGPLDDTLAMGRKALANDGVATAWKLAQQVLSAAPESAAAHEFAGEVRFRQGEFGEADAEFKTALEWDQRNALAWWGLGRVAECTSMNKTAVEDFHRAYELNPNDPRILMTWFPRLRGQESIDALQRYVAGLKAAGRNPAADGNLNHLRQDSELAKALNGHPAMELASPYRSAEVPLQTFINGANVRSYGLQVMLEGQPAQLVLDTGASGIVLSHAAAERLGLTRVGGAAVRGIGDNSRLRGAYRGLAGSLQIGSVEYRNVPVSVSNQTFTGLQDGLIGANVLGQFLMTLDFPDRKLHLDPLPDYHPGELRDRTVVPPLENAARVFRFGHLLLVPVNVGSAKNRLFVLDSGAGSTMISYQLAEEVSNLNRDDKVALGGLNGRVSDVYRTGTLALDFAGFEQRSLGIAAFDTWQLSHEVGTEISGFLGLPVLDLFTLTIDYEDGLVKFDRKP